MGLISCFLYFKGVKSFSVSSLLWVGGGGGERGEKGGEKGGRGGVKKW